MAQSKVLLVDDNRIYVHRLLKLLDEEGIANPIFTAGNYEEAISLIANQKPQIIFLDMNMPGKSGVEVLYYIKAAGWDCKVIMVTNHSTDNYKKFCLDSGANYFLDKSKDFNLIPSLIKEITMEYFDNNVT
jgi:CheY-like chemotaxis protein